MSTEIPKDVSLSILNIGTAIMVRDVMDQHLRTLGDVRTYYASNLHFALQTYSERHLDLIFCELTFPGGSAEEFIRQIGGIDATDNLYFCISTGQDARAAKWLADELSVDSILESPFSTNDILARVSSAISKKNRDRNAWIDGLLEAKLAAKNMRTQEARTLFRDLIKNHPSNADIQIAAAKFFIGMADFDNAGQILTQAIAADPQNLLAKSLYGVLSLKKGDYADGLKILEEVQKISPLNSTRANEIANAYILMALKCARDALDINSASVLALVNSIKYLTVLGRYSEVINMYERNKDKFIGDEKREADFFFAVSKKLGGIA